MQKEDSFFKKEDPNFILLKHLMLKLNFTFIYNTFSCNSIQYVDFLYEMHKKKKFYKSIYNGKNSIHRNNFSYQLSASSK